MSRCELGHVITQTSPQTEHCCTTLHESAVLTSLELNCCAQIDVISAFSETNKLRGLSSPLVTLTVGNNTTIQKRPRKMKMELQDGGRKRSRVRR
jgi:hypothetical protein